MHLAPSRNDRMVGAIAEAIQGVFLGGTASGADEIGSVSIWVEGDQIESVASGTVDAMANPSRHVVAQVGPTRVQILNRVTKVKKSDVKLPLVGTDRSVWDATEPCIGHADNVA